MNTMLWTVAYTVADIWAAALTLITGDKYEAQ